jgi:hypothetical protein
MSKKKQNELKEAQVFLIKSQAVSLVLKESFPYFKYTCVLLSAYLLGPSGVTATKSVLRLIGWL